ncbi:MAG TPA: sigma-70 family RNA polymerase sigma factor [Chryseolinea sp.]|nr:sigma-70 family RNA polymerase sigma factor [Chryseolinea sp.]
MGINQDTYHSDADLAAALSNGDKKAFEAIYRKYASDLFRHIQRNISRREDCEEILQDVFEWLWKNRSSTVFHSLWGYLFTAVNSRILMYFRKSKARRNYERHYLLFEGVFEYFQEEDARGTIDPEALQSLLQNSLPELPARYQEAFRLRLTENLSNAEIAERMNIKKDTVENYFVRVLRHLHDSYRRLYNTG